MKLRSKLFLSIGLLTFALVIVLYALPTFFIRKDIHKTAHEIQQVLLENRQNLKADAQDRFETKIKNALSSLEHTLSQRISGQLLLILSGAIIVFLIIMGKFGFELVNAITQLAQATKFVVAGRYSEVILPEIGHRRDEVSDLTASFREMVEGLQEREKIRAVLDKVVSKEVADKILKTNIQLGGEDRIVSVLFGDIREFATLSLSLSPQTTIEILNSCMTKMSRIIETEGGIIDKYIGDAIMALYGAPTLHPEHALRAVSSGMLMIETLKAWNQQRENQDEPPISMGIGIHTGLVVAGNMGSEDRLNYTVVGANVNLAERLCDVAKANQLIITAATVQEPHVADSFYLQRLEPLIFKGFSEAVEIFEVKGFKWTSTVD